MIDKRKILDAAIAGLTAEVATLMAAADATYRGATHEEAKPENSKDTRALEASYLARGQAKRVEEANETIQRLKFLELRAYDPDDPVGPTAVVEVDVDGERTDTLFLVPHGGGRDVDVEGTTVRVVTIASPVGRGLLGKHVGDDFTLTIHGKKREYVIESVC